jgi:hypothetical protein
MYIYMQMGELLHIFRPVLYVILVRALRNKKSWTPWVVSLAVDLLSARCSSLAVTAPTRASGRVTATANGSKVGAPASASGVLQLLIMGQIAGAAGGNDALIYLPTLKMFTSYHIYRKFTSIYW